LGTTLKKIQDLMGLKNEEELIFFGGTFDPWHEGHEACLKLVPKNKKIFLVPDRNPFKEYNQRNSQDVYTELNKVVDSYQKQGYQLDLYGDFLSNEKKNPTYFWMKEINDQYPHVKLSLLLGYDSFKSLPQWIEASKLLSIINCLYVVSRNEDEWEKLEDMKEIEKINRDIFISFLGHHTFEHLSSTELRKKKGT
jgi:nicotinate-nucleotide adenylyltransferase